MTNKTILQSNWPQDIKAALVVFLIALPLSLGISLASGAPPTAGIVSAILGGLLGAYLGGSYVTINGPAAGLIVVVFSSIQTLSSGDPLTGFKRTLACIIVVGVLQILSGIFKAGRFVSLFPISVIHGMLTAIGLIIIIKQIHVFFGHRAQGSLLESIAQIPSSVIHLNPEAGLIGLGSLLILVLYPQLKINITKYIPAPLVVVGFGMFLASFFLSVDKVSIPLKISKFIIAPQFDMIFSLDSIQSIITIFFVASLESILSASAVDKLDPQERESNFDRELWSKGIVNISCGILGGLPIIAEIVRSSANINQGAKTPFANFTHSGLILAFVLLFPRALNMIPLPALAAILILVGYRLAQPKQFKEMLDLGTSSFWAFSTTIILTLVDDLLVGIFAGILVKAIISLIQGAELKSFFSPKYQLTNQGDKAILKFEGSLLFFSALKQKQILSEISNFNEVEINLLDIRYMDATSMSILCKESMKLTKSGHKIKFEVPLKLQIIFRHIHNH